MYSVYIEQVMKTFLYIIVTIFTMVSCSNHDTTTTDAKADSTETTTAGATVRFTENQVRNAGITVGTPKEESLGQTLTLQGQIDLPPQSNVSLSFPLGGYLRSTDMLPGVHVRKGQVLGIMEDMQYIQLQQDYLTARSAFTLAQTEYNRQKELNASKAASDKVLQTAQAEMEKQHILTNALQQKLELIGINPQNLHAGNISRRVAITSPIDGYVAKVNVNVGRYTTPTDVLFELVDPRDIHLVLSVFEKDLGSLAIGQKVSAYTNNDPGKKYDAEILLIGKNLDADRAAEVHCHFEHYDASLVPGMFMNGEITVTGRKALTVPESAVVRWENKYYIFEEKSTGTFSMVQIQPGVSSQGKQTLQTGPVDTQTRIVTDNAYALLMKIKNSEAED